ncbi:MULTISPECIES: sulfatase-like hydrolase/transferase [Haloarcula]|uniref:sulfatase-like hydrolase/transferase n=1 Tax=Haloarcula TaxID=2237 RepID=UPI0023ED119A|nr:sulfatase-like hydrolase/transferase [Halomicroarcula sp. XH51]
MITVDSLRADTCGFIGDTGCTPFLSSIADRSLIFENAISPGPRTPSSIPVLLTGEFNRHDGYHMRSQRNAIRHHLRTHSTIPERVSQSGYTTVGFSANPWTAIDTGFDDIFDEFVELNPASENGVDAFTDMKTVRGFDYFLEKIGQTDFLKWESRREWLSHWAGYYDQIRERVRSLDEPYFVWIFLMDTHQPYIVPRDFREDSSGLKMYLSLLNYARGRAEGLSEHSEQWLKECYRDAARSADEFIRRLAQDLEASAPILLMHSDHGESHGDHATYGHEQQLFEENIRVPLLIHGTDQNDAVTDPLSLSTLPRLVELLTEGRADSLGHLTTDFVLSDVESIPVANRRAKKMNYTPHYCSIRGKRYKYIQTPEGPELYDLHADSNEMTNIADPNRDLVAQFERLANVKTAKQIEKKRLRSAIGDSALSASQVSR